MRLRIGNSVSDEFLADDFVDERLAGTVVREQEPANGDQKEETDAQKLISLECQRLAGFAFPKCCEESCAGEGDAERSLGESCECGHYPKPRPTFALSPRAKAKHGSSC